MNRYRFVAIATSLAAGLVSTMAMAESGEGNIVISDNFAPYGNTCNSGHVIKQAWCLNSYCDNNILHCGTSTYNGQTITTSGSPYWKSYYTSDEYFTSDPGRAVCPNGYALVGMESTGDYSDNIRVRCQAMKMPDVSPCWWTQFEYPYYVSDETGPTAYEDIFLSGFRCGNSYCDNMFYKYQYMSCPIP